MSMETDTRITEAAAAYRAAKFELVHTEVLCGAAQLTLTQAERDLARAEADVLAAESHLESLACADQEEVRPWVLPYAARRLKALRVALTQAEHWHTKAGGAMADRDNERLQARHAAAQARTALYEEALNA